RRTHPGSNAALAIRDGMYRHFWPGHRRAALLNPDQHPYHHADDPPIPDALCAAFIHRGGSHPQRLRRRSDDGHLRTAALFLVHVLSDTEGPSSSDSSPSSVSEPIFPDTPVSKTVPKVSVTNTLTVNPT